METISNPMMDVTDLPAIALTAHRHEAKLIVDNSFATPVICQPLKSGADIVVYSATKYIGGHSDVTAGIVVAGKADIDRIYASGLLFGPTLSPFDGWLLVRAEYFSQHPRIKATHCSAVWRPSSLPQASQVWQPRHPGRPRPVVLKEKGMEKNYLSGLPGVIQFKE